MTIATLGTVAILALFLMAVSTAVLAIAGQLRDSDRMIEGAVAGVHATFGFALFSSLLLVYAFLAGDTSIQYVQHNSHPAMPVFYKITAFWGSLDGSSITRTRRITTGGAKCTTTSASSGVRASQRFGSISMTVRLPPSSRSRND